MGRAACAAWEVRARQAARGGSAACAGCGSPPDRPVPPNTPQNHTNIPPSTALGQPGVCPSPLLCQGMGKLEQIRELPKPRCAFRAPSPSRGWGAKKKKKIDVQGMNIYLWVASDRCWGEDSWILQFAGGNNWNRLMRNILPLQLPPRCRRSRTQRPLGPKHTKFSQAWCPKGWRCPDLVVSTQNGARQLGKGMWPLPAGS